MAHNHFAAGLLFDEVDCCRIAVHVGQKSVMCDTVEQARSITSDLLEEFDWNDIEREQLKMVQEMTERACLAFERITRPTRAN